MVQPLWRTVWRFLEKLKTELPYDPAIPLLGIYPEKNMAPKETCTHAHCSTVYNSQDMQTTYTSTERQMGKEDAVYTKEYEQPLKRMK